MAGEPMYWFLQHCNVRMQDESGAAVSLPPPPAATPQAHNHDFDQDRAILGAIKADEKESEQEFATIMDRVERWNRVHNKPAVPARRGGRTTGGGGGAAPPPSYNTLPAGYDGRQVPSGGMAPPTYPAATPPVRQPAPSPVAQPPAYPTYGGPPSYGAAAGGGGAAPPPYAAAVVDNAGWTCRNCTYQVQPNESRSTCPVCANPR